MKGKACIQVCRLMQPGFQPLRLEPGFFKDLRIRRKIDLRPALLRFSDHRKQPVLKLCLRDAPLIAIFIDRAVSRDANGHVRRQGIDHRGTDAVQTTARLVCVIVKLAPRMQRRHDNTLCRNPLFMHLHRDSASVIAHRTGAVRLQRNPDRITVPGQVLIYRVIHNFINQMIQGLLPHAADVHAGAFAHGFESLQHRNAVCVVLCF
ncbi:Uncharacterised protein [Chlamydia trachomatis]|nr:Uncharacterised protein [Chlamydia trachomatis]